MCFGITSEVIINGKRLLFNHIKIDSLFYFKRTFILYYQPCSQIEQSDNDWLPFEIAYATAIYEVKPNASKKEYFPSNHTLRLMFVNEDGLESYKVPIPDEGNDITENDFEALQAI